MNLRNGLSLTLLLVLVACASTPPPGTPVAAGDGYVWLLKDGGRSALWGPPASEAVFTVACDAARGQVELHHYGVVAPERVGELRIEAGGRAASYPVRLERIDIGDRLVAAVPAGDPFLRHMRQAGQWRVHAGDQTLLIGAAVPPPRTVLEDCAK